MVARDAASVEIFDEKGPTRRYREIAIVDAEREPYGMASDQELLFLMRARASDMGCDGLVLKAPIWRNSAPGRSRPPDGIRAVCIVYEPD